MNNYTLISKVLLGFLILSSPLLRAQNAAILEGAKKELENKTRYNTEMLEKYVPPTYKNGVDTKKPVYPMGDVNPGEGVCTDLVVRALRHAGIDLQQLVHNDVKANKSKYGVRTPDKYIDHRRVWILRKFFKRNYTSLSTAVEGDNAHWQAGDVIIWDIGSDDHFHIGIISDKRTKKNVPLVIHNMPSIPFIFPGVTCEQNVILGPKLIGIGPSWKILGHFRLGLKK